MKADTLSGVMFVRRPGHRHRPMVVNPLQPFIHSFATFGPFSGSRGPLPLERRPDDAIVRAGCCEGRGIAGPSRRFGIRVFCSQVCSTHRSVTRTLRFGMRPAIPAWWAPGLRRRRTCAWGRLAPGRGWPGPRRVLADRLRGYGVARGRNRRGTFGIRGFRYEAKRGRFNAFRRRQLSG